MAEDNFVFQGVLDNTYYVFEPDYLDDKLISPPIAFLFTKEDLATILSQKSFKVGKNTFLKPLSLSSEDLKLAHWIYDYIKYSTIENALWGLDHTENRGLRDIAMKYILGNTHFIDVEYEGCFRGYEIYAPRMSHGGMEAITMIIAIHPYHSDVFTLGGPRMDAILQELNFTAMRRSVLTHPAVGLNIEPLYVGKYRSKDVLRLINADGTSEEVPRYVYSTYASNWRFVRGDEIQELSAFMPSVGEQDEAVAAAREMGFQTACYIGTYEGYKVYNVYMMPPCYDSFLAGVLQKDGRTLSFDENNPQHLKIFSWAEQYMEENRYVDSAEVEGSLKDHLKNISAVNRFCSRHKLTVQAALGTWCRMTVLLAYHVRTDLSAFISKTSKVNAFEWKYLMLSENKVIICPECLLSQIEHEYQPFYDNDLFKTFIDSDTEFTQSAEEKAADEIISPSVLFNMKSEGYKAADGCALVRTYLEKGEPGVSKKEALAFINKIKEFSYGLNEDSLRQDIEALSKARIAFKERYKEKAQSSTINTLARFRYPLEGVFFDVKESDLEDTASDND